MLRKDVLVIGIGNEFGGDDAAGLLAVRALEGRLPPSVRVVEHGGEATSLVETWKNHACVFVVDAVRSGAPAGSVLRWEGITELPEIRVASSHALGLGEALRLGRVLGAMPRALVLYGIEGARFGPGDPMSDEVGLGAAQTADRLVQEISALAREGEHHA